MEKENEFKDSSFKDGYTGARLEPKIPGSSASRLSKGRNWV